MGHLTSYDRGMRELVRKPSRPRHRRGPGRGAPDYKAHLRRWIPIRPYAGHVSQRAKDAPEPSAVLERVQFRKWVKRVIAQLQAVNGWTIPKVAAGGGISPDTLYAWKRDGDTWPDGKPKPKTVMKFCIKLGLDLMEPFEALGWLPKSLREPQPIMPRLAQDLARFLIDPNVDKSEKRMVSTAVERLLAPHLRRPPQEPGEPAA